MFCYCLSIDWAERFVVLIERYANIIRGLIYGHVHENYFTLIKGVKREPISVAYVCPSLTTHTYNRPTYRVFEMDRDTYQLTDYVQYSMNIEKSNEENKPIWGESYRFTKYFDVPSLSIRSHQILLDKMKTNKDNMWNKALTMKYQEGPKGDEYFNDKVKSKEAMCDYECSTIQEKIECYDIPSRDAIDCFTYEYKPIFCKSWQDKIKKSL